MSAVSVLLRNGSHEPLRPEFPNRAAFGKRRVLSGVHSGPQILISNEDEPSCISSAWNPHSAETAHDSFRRTPSPCARKLVLTRVESCPTIPLTRPSFILWFQSYTFHRFSQSTTHSETDLLVQGSVHRSRSAVDSYSWDAGCGVCFWWPSHVPTTDVARCSFASSPAGLVSRERDRRE